MCGFSIQAIRIILTYGMWTHELLLYPSNNLAVSLLFSSTFISTGNVIPVTC